MLRRPPLRRFDPRWVAILATLTGPACSPPDVGLDPLPCSSEVGEEVFDPYRHDVCLSRCYDGFDCPRGSICAKDDESAENGFCTLPDTGFQTSQRALLQGFGVEEMTASLHRSERYEMQWTRPRAAKLVSCALFVCPPAFRTRQDDGEWSAPADPSHVEIANFHHCVVASERSSRPEGAFNLQERDNEHKLPRGFAEEHLPSSEESNCPPNPDEAGNSGPHGCAPVTELLAGCWAYDDWRIVAATRLFPVDGREIYSYYNTFAPSGDCRSGDRYRICVLDQAVSTPSYGVCTPASDGGAVQCRRPCLSNDDCDDVPSVNGNRAPSTATGVCDDAGTCTAIPVAEDVQ